MEAGYEVVGGTKRLSAVFCQCRTFGIGLLYSCQRRIILRIDAKFDTNFVTSVPLFTGMQLPSRRRIILRTQLPANHIFLDTSLLFAYLQTQYTCVDWKNVLSIEASATCTK